MNGLFFKNNFYIGLCLIIMGCSSVPVSKEAITKDNQKERAVSVLNDLIQVEIDIYHTYTQAIDSIKSQSALKTLHNFRDRHEQYIRELSTMVLNKGGTPPEFSRDFKGYVISGYTSVKSAGGDHSVLKAMESNELLSNKYHRDALKVDLPIDLRNAITKHLRMKESHIVAIRELKHKIP